MAEPAPLGLSSACLRGDFTATMLPEIEQAGFTHLEIFPTDHPWLQTLHDFELLGQQVRDCGLITWSLHAPFGYHIGTGAADEVKRREAIGTLTTALDQAQALGASVVVVHPGYYDPATEEREPALLRVVRSFNELWKRASQRGLKLAMEYLPPKPADLGCSAAELLWLRDLIDGEVGFCLDVNHANLPEDLLAVVPKLGPSLLTTHISDNDGLEERHWLPGEGVIDWPGLIRALRAAAYPGPLLLESGNFPAETPAQKLAALSTAAHRLQADV